MIPIEKQIQMFNGFKDSDISDKSIYQRPQILTDEDIKNSQNMPIRIKYDLIDLGHTDFSFKSMNKTEVLLYFQRMQNISTSSINEIIDFNDKGKCHWHHSNIAGKLKDALEKLNKDFTKSNPFIYHFALDPTSTQFANREKKIRNPRIYFIVGREGEIHILFFDAYHELNPNPQPPPSTATSTLHKKTPLLKEAKKRLKQNR